MISEDMRIHMRFFAEFGRNYAVAIIHNHVFEQASVSVRIYELYWKQQQVGQMYAYSNFLLISLVIVYLV